MTRRPIQITAVPAFETADASMFICDAIYALCDDGTVWVMASPQVSAEWKELPAVPQYVREEVSSDR